MREEAAQEMQRRAEAAELFAYPTSRRFPLATAGLLAASGALTAGAALYWHLVVCRCESEADLREEVGRFAALLGTGSVSADDLCRGEVHRLVLTSIVRVGEESSRTVADAILLVCCGTLLEKLHGPACVLGLAVGGSALGNLVAPLAHRAITADGSARVSSTSGGVVALGALCAARYGRWCAAPLVPFPIGWLLVPVLVADLYAVGRYVRWYNAAPPAGDSEGADLDPLPEGVDVPSGLELSMSLAACEKIQQRVRAQCRPPLEDLESWEAAVLEPALQRQAAATPPDYAFAADLAGLLLGLVAGFALRSR